MRVYELDANGHVNNAVYLNWAEHIAAEHAEAVGFGPAWTLARGGGWVARRHEITYLQPARYGDLLDLTTRVEKLHGARAVRRTTIGRAADGVMLAEALTEWVWIQGADGRPARVPSEVVAAFHAEPG